MIAPWSVRNYLVFDRFIPTSANGGAVVYLGNHAGATGGRASVVEVEIERSGRIIEVREHRQDVVISGYNAIEYQGLGPARK